MLGNDLKELAGVSVVISEKIDWSVDCIGEWFDNFNQKNLNLIYLCQEAGCK